MMKDFYCFAQDVPNASEDVFQSSYVGYAILHVPAAAIASYQAGMPWSEFGEIVSLTDTDLGIEGKECQERKVVSYFSPGGKQLQSPQRGLNIVRHSDGTTTKVVVK